MALGGIPVTGGITGKGTLLSTNLLRTPLILAASGYYKPSFTLGGTAGVAGFEAAYIKDGDPKTLYKTASLGTEITLTMVLDGSVKPDVYGVVIDAHNLVAASMITAKIEGGNGNYTDVSEDLVINAALLTPAYKLFSAVASGMDRWRLRIQFSSAMALQIGEVFLIGASPTAFARNFNWEGNPLPEFGRVSSSGIAGITRTRTIWIRYRREMFFENISQAQRDSLQLANLNGYVVLSPEGASGCAYLGVLEITSEKDRKGGTYDLTAVFTEAAR